jgi:hypothetical protein
MSSITLSELFYESEPGIICWKVDRFGGRGYKCKKASAGDVAGYLHKELGRWKIQCNGKLMLRSRVVWELHNGPIEDGIQIDHVSRNTHDDSIGNLRLATRKQNMCNRSKHKNNTSGLKGVSWDGRTCKWVAQIVKDRKHINLGRYETKYLAYSAYCDAALELHGEFACV